MNKFFSIFVSLGLSLTFTSAAFAQEDTTAPESPDNVIATAGDGKVTLEWDASIDTDAIGYKAYYGMSSVTEAGQEYDFTVDVGNVLERVIEDLENGTMYYFAVTAYDDAGNESESYSIEQTATPEADAEIDDIAPTVTSAEAVSSTIVRVVFSEAIVLPEEDPEMAFSIENTVTNEPLEVLTVEADLEDIEGKTLLLTTAEQEEVEYLLTAGIDIEDASGNPIESGESDTASFDGIAPEEPEVPDAPEDDIAPQIIDADSISSTQIEVIFSEEIVLEGNAEDNFSIVEKENESVSLSVYGAELSSDQMTVTITTEEQTGNVEYRLTVSNITDLAGNIIADDYTALADFTYEVEEDEPGDDTPETSAPEDVTDLTTTVEDTVFDLSWTASENSAGDLANYVVYYSTDDGATYNDGTLLAADTTSFTMELDANQNYVFKVTARDNDGNESEGVTTGICLSSCPEEEEEENEEESLPETGPGMIGALILLSVLAGWGISRRKRVA